MSWKIVLTGVVLWSHFAGAVALGAAAAQAEGQDPASSSPEAQSLPVESSRQVPKLVVSEPHVDLGVVRQGSVYDFTYVVTNRGGSNLLIRRIRSTCGCTVARPNKPQVLKPGEQLTVDASFDSANRVGPQRKTIEVYSNDPMTPKVELSFSAVVEAVYQLRPNIKVLKFRNKRRGETLDRKLSVLSGKKDSQIEILDVTFSSGGISHTIEPITERGYDGFRLSLTLNDDVPIGRYQGDLQIKVSTNGEQDLLTLPIDGEVISDITVRPTYLLEVASILPGEQLRIGRITLQAVNRGTPFQIRRVETGPKLTCTIEETQPGLEYRLQLSVAGSAENGPFATTVLILTNNDEQPVISVPVYVNIGSAAEVRPEIVFLRRESGSPRQAAQVVRITSRGRELFTIQRTSSDNPNFLVTLKPGDPSNSSHEVVVTLAESAAVGEHKGVARVFTSLAGGGELKIPLYAEVTEEP